jgi:hypothetical protein
MTPARKVTATVTFISQSTVDVSFNVGDDGNGDDDGVDKDVEFTFASPGPQRHETFYVRNLLMFVIS